MKNLFDKDLAFIDLKSNLKKLRRKNKNRFVLLMSMSILILIGVVVLIIMKFRKDYGCDCDDFYDEDYDDDSYYAGVHHFED